MTEFRRLYTGRVWSVMGWDQLTAFWRRIDPAAGWYLIAVGVSPPPTIAATADEVSRFIERIDALLRADHRESYCGIVYADDPEQPRIVKIFDPNNLGASCGSSKNPPPPGWVMSRVAPDADALPAPPPPAGRRRWWQALRGDS